MLISVNWDFEDYKLASKAIILMSIAMTIGIPQFVSRAVMQGVGLHWSASIGKVVASFIAFGTGLVLMWFDLGLIGASLGWCLIWILPGIFYFPKLNNDLNIQKDRIQLYQNQVFVTDNVEGIVPEFLTLLRGVIDSPDIPLNVSRSYLQADGAVKKISNYITRKVADKLSSLFKKDRKGFEEKWNDIKVVIEYGMLSEDKFFEKAEKFALFPTTDGDYFTFEELQEKVKDNQTDKDGKLILLYASQVEEQHSYIQAAKDKGYTVLLLDSPIISHLIQKLETSKENLSFARVDGDAIENLIKKDEATVSKLSEEEIEKLKPIIEEVVTDEKYIVQLEAMDSQGLPFVLTQPEFMRRMKEMQQTGGGMMGSFPEMYTLLVNTNHSLVGQILNTKTAKKRERLIKQGLDLARLSQNLLKGVWNYHHMY